MALRIVRSSINAFLDGYQSFTSIAALLVLPASASILLSQALVPFSGPVVKTISFRLSALFQAARFPASAEFFALLNVKLAQTVFSFLATLPIVLTFLLVAKACVVLAVCGGGGRIRRGTPSLSTALRLYRSILPTHLFNSFLLLSTNATVFAFLFLVFNVADVLGLATSTALLLLLSAAGAVLYSVVIANATVICNLALVVAAVDDCGGLLPALKAFLLVRGRASTALGLALPANLGMAAVEALFQYRVVRQYNISGELSSSLLWEAFSIAYFHASLLILEVIMNCKFYEVCTVENKHEHERHQGELELKEKPSLFV
ncbi:uncharacterized protein LOC122027987 [Zingiber officinale]|uniref:Transmembrane protein n=1 Tax=Zingiber officinale TaxID=94328 RepID=A0A8J5EDP5_ZINOF|nr:uncharacterized protein LOC122027987 [Zingiber officinale]KAG6473104.1 hypothetical protein ZIOFF_067011 [Zingiber officinale]